MEIDDGRHLQARLTILGIARVAPHV